MAWIGALVSGAVGLYSADQARKAGREARAGADPFAPYRGEYAQQMQRLMRDPGSIVSAPGYQAGLQGVMRSMAAQGYQGSGNMMAALQDYSGDFYNQTLRMLGGFAGAGVDPGTGAKLGYQGTMAGVDLTGQSLASLGFGLELYRAGRGGGGSAADTAYEPTSYRRSDAPESLWSPGSTQF